MNLKDIGGIGTAHLSMSDFLDDSSPIPCTPYPPSVREGIRILRVMSCNSVEFVHEGMDESQLYIRVSPGWVNPFKPEQIKYFLLCLRVEGLGIVAPRSAIPPVNKS